MRVVTLLSISALIYVTGCKSTADDSLKSEITRDRITDGRSPLNDDETLEVWVREYRLGNVSGQNWLTRNRLSLVCLGEGWEGRTWSNASVIYVAASIPIEAPKDFYNLKTLEGVGNRLLINGRKLNQEIGNRAICSAIAFAFNSNPTPDTPETEALELGSKRLALVASGRSWGQVGVPYTIKGMGAGDVAESDTFSVGFQTAIYRTANDNADSPLGVSYRWSEYKSLLADRTISKTGRGELQKHAFLLQPKMQKFRVIGKRALMKVEFGQLQATFKTRKGSDRKKIFKGISDLTQGRSVNVGESVGSEALSLSIEGSQIATSLARFDSITDPQLKVTIGESGRLWGMGSAWASAVFEIKNILELKSGCLQEAAKVETWAERIVEGGFELCKVEAKQ